MRFDFQNVYVLAVVTAFILFLLLFWLFRKRRKKWCKGGNGAREEADAVLTKWYRQSGAVKAERVFAALSAVACPAAAVAVVAKMVPPLSAELEKSDFAQETIGRELYFAVTDILLTSFSEILLVWMACSLVALMLTVHSGFDLEKWVFKEDIDCYRILTAEKKKSYARFCLGNAFLFEKRPSAKNICFFRIVGNVAADAIFFFALRGFLSRAFAAAYDFYLDAGMTFGDWCREVFLSFGTVLFLLSVLTVMLFDVLVRRMMRYYQDDLISEIEEGMEED